MAMKFLGEVTLSSRSSIISITGIPQDGHSLIAFGEVKGIHPSSGSESIRYTFNSNYDANKRCTATGTDLLNDSSYNSNGLQTNYSNQQFILPGHPTLAPAGSSTGTFVKMYIPDYATTHGTKGMLFEEFFDDGNKSAIAHGGGRNNSTDAVSSIEIATSGTFEVGSKMTLYQLLS
jgi:hypothetical protein